MALVFRSVTKTSLFHSTGDKLPDGTFHNDSLANIFKKDFWCWSKVHGLIETEDNVHAKKFLEDEQRKLAFDNADLQFNNSKVLTCANKLLNEIRKFPYK